MGRRVAPPNAGLRDDLIDALVDLDVKLGAAFERLGDAAPRERYALAIETLERGEPYTCGADELAAALDVDEGRDVIARGGRWTVEPDGEYHPAR